MSAPIDYCGSWKTRRYAWKKQISNALSLNRGAAVLAMYLCDNYANHKTACCWPSNKTLADNLKVDVRSIQRWLRDLRIGGWVSPVNIRGHRRAIQLTFPPVRERDIEHDMQSDSDPTVQSFKHDKNVVPYIKPKKNLNNDGCVRRQESPISYHFVSWDDEHYLSAWKQWIVEHLKASPDEVLECVKAGGGYNLPSRYPGETPMEQRKNKEFFEQAVQTEGRIFKQ